MASEHPPVHEERPWPGSLVRLILDPLGLIREEFTSGVPTHRLVIPYAEIWDTTTTQRFPVAPFVVLLALTLGWTASLGFAEIPAALSALNGMALGVAWALFCWRARLRTVRVFDYDGYELAQIHAVPGPPFDGFLAGLETRVAAHRYPLQILFESLDLGRVEVPGRITSWTGAFLYDRVSLSQSGPGRLFSRAYHALSSLEAPIRLAWRIPWSLLGLSAASAVAGLLSASEWVPFGMGALRIWAWGSFGISLLSGALGVARVGVSVEIASVGHPVRTPPMPWWRREQRRRVLAWFARLVHLADRLEEISTEDYWDFHRAKLQILRDEGFIGDWPYRSALARLNSQEREEPGE